MIDEPLTFAYCSTYELLLGMVEDIKKRGPVIIAPNGKPQENPSVSVLANQVRLLRSLIASFDVWQPPLEDADVDGLTQSISQN